LQARSCWSLTCAPTGYRTFILTGTVEKGWTAFLILGVGLNVACIVVTVFLLSRRRWN